MVFQTYKGLSLGAIVPHEYVHYATEIILGIRRCINVFQQCCILSCHLITKSAREVDQDIPRRAQRGNKKIYFHTPEVKRGAMGLLVTPFQGLQEPAKNTPSPVLLRQPLAPFGTAHYRMAATPSEDAEILLPGFLHAKKGT